ncbi:hypothetical protein ACLMAB_19360 [Brevibacillus laterosporus]
MVNEMYRECNCSVILRGIVRAGTGLSHTNERPYCLWWSSGFVHKLCRADCCRVPLEKIGEVIEFFCPIFHVVTYRDEQEVVDWLHAPERVESTLGASVFGVPELVEKLRSTHIVSENLSLYDIENGNHPFGGYGLQANYVCHQGNFTSRPLLISKEVSAVFGRK